MEIKPTVGRVVYYKSRGSADGVFPSVDRAAIITDVMKDSTVINGSGGQMVDTGVRLCVLNPEGMFFTDWLEQGQNGGNWDWMPFQKVQQARLSTDK